MIVLLSLETFYTSAISVWSKRLIDMTVDLPCRECIEILNLRILAGVDLVFKEDVEAKKKMFPSGTSALSLDTIPCVSMT